MQASTSTIAKYSRSFNVEHARSQREENVKEKIAYSEFQAFGEPFASLGTVGDTYVDITSKNCALYAKFEGGWKKWPGPTQRTTPLHHPVHSTHVLWCKLDKKVLGWIPVKSLSRVLISSSSQVISTILDARHTALQKHAKKQSKNHPLPPPTKKLRLDEPSTSSAQPDSLTDPVRNSSPNYWFSFPPFVDSTVTFIDKAAFPTMDLRASDSKPQPDAQHNATREARRASKHMAAQNMLTNGLPELDDDFMAESQRIMNAIMGSTKGSSANADVAEAPMHETQLPNPPLEDPPAPRVPSPSCPQTLALRSNSSGSSSTLSDSAPVMSLANPEPPRLPTTPESRAKLPNSPIPAVKKQTISPVARKRSSWVAMLDEEEVHRVGASSSAPQIKSENELEHSKASSSFSTSVPLRKMPSPPKLHTPLSSPSAKEKGKAKAADASSTPSTPISAKKERPPSAVESKEVANQVISSGSGLTPRIFDDMQPESPLAPPKRQPMPIFNPLDRRRSRLPPANMQSESPPAPQERQSMPRFNPLNRWRPRLPPARLNLSPAFPSTSTSPSRFTVRHSKSDLTGAAPKHVPLQSVQKPTPESPLDASASSSSPSTKSLARKEEAVDGGTATTNVQAVRKRSPSPMNVGLGEEMDHRDLDFGEDWPLPPDDEPPNPNSRSPSSAPANIKLEKGTPPSSPAPLPKKLQNAATSASAPAALAGKRLGKGLASSASARANPKWSRVVSDKGVLDLTGVDSDNDDNVIEVTPDRKVRKSASVIMSPTKFKVKGRDSPSSMRKLKVMPKYMRRLDYKRKATADREAKAKQQLQNELNMESVIDLTLDSDEDEDDQIIVRPLLLARKSVSCVDEVEKRAISVVKEENMFGDIEMVDLPAPSCNNVEDDDAGLGGDVDMSNADDVTDGKGLADDEVSKDEDDKNDYDNGDGGLPIGSEDAQDDVRDDNSHEEEGELSGGGGEGDEEMNDFVPPLAHLPEPQSDSETESSHTATEEEVDELKDEDDGSEHELEDGEDLPDLPDLQLSSVHLQLLFDLDGKRYCRACLSNEPTVYWQVPPGSVELVSGQLLRHCISVHLQICEQFAALDHDELQEIERTVM